MSARKLTDEEIIQRLNTDKRKERYSVFTDVECGMFEGLFNVVNILKAEGWFHHWIEGNTLTVDLGCNNHD